MEAVRAHVVSLTGYALRTLSERLGDKLTVHGPAEPATRGGTLSLDLVGVHAHDISQILHEAGVCVRAGHHCAKPLMRRLSLPGTARPSLHAYNHEPHVHPLADALQATSPFFTPRPLSPWAPNGRLASTFPAPKRFNERASSTKIVRPPV